MSHFDEVGGKGGCRSNFGSEIDGGSRCAAHVAVDGSGNGDAGEAGGGERDAESRGDQACESGPLRRILDDVGPEAASFAAGDGAIEGEGAHAAGEEDEGLVLEIANPDVLFAGERVRFRQDGDERLFEQGVQFEALGGIAVAEEGEIERSVEEGSNLNGRAHFPQAEFDLGEAAAVMIDDDWKPGEHDGADETDCQRSFFTAAEPADLDEIVLHFFESASRAISE